MAIVFENVTTYATTDLTQSFSVTVGSNNGTILVAGLAYRDSDGTSGSVPSNVTYAGDAMTMLVDEKNTQAGTSIWYVVNPATGDNTLSWTHVGGLHASVVVEFSGVDVSTPWGATTYATDATPASTDTITLNHTVTESGGQKTVLFGMHQNRASGDITASPYFTGTDAVTTHGYIELKLSTTSMYALMGSANNPPSYTYGLVATPVTSTKQNIGFLAGVLLPAASARARSVKYFYDIYNPSGAILDETGRQVPPWEIKPDNWIKVSGIFPPTSKVYDSFLEDPELAYIESVKWTMGGGVRIKTSRGDLGEVLLARAAGRKTL